jgi:SAM-dependent methyltransferase
MSIEAKRREKDYLARSGSLEWERLKPFAPPATDTLAESVRLIHDFAVALNALDAAGNHLILDLGAGACWTSEWLHRLNLDVVSIDIAHEMLKVGRARGAGSPWPLTAGDLEALPFESGSFDRALCLNALHHLPAPGRGLAEIARVLTGGGRLVLIEPGLGHADNPTSVRAVSDFGVTERELEPTALMQLCLAAGFATVRLRPLSYATGEIELTLDEVWKWRRWTRTARPLRAAAKLRLAALEIFGRAKAGELFEDSLSMWVSRVLLRHVGEQGVVVASKDGYAPASGQFRAAIALDPGGPVTVRGGALACRLRVENTGSTPWRTAGRARGRVQLGVRLMDGTGGVLGEACRVDLPEALTPRAACWLDVAVPLHAAPDARFAKFDLVAEHVAWFETQGSDPLIVGLPAGRTGPDPIW